MKFNIKKFKLLKIKQYFTNQLFFFFCNSTTSLNIIKKSQKFKYLNFKYYKTYNTLTKKILKKSLYKNYKSLITSSIVLITPQKNINFKNIQKIQTVTAIKLNNKIYSIKQLNFNDQFSYINNSFRLFKVYKTSLKPIKVFSNQ